MVKFIRVAMIALAIQGFTLGEARAERRAYCQAALEGCISQCGGLPSIFREAGMIGCGIGYLNC